MGTRCLTIIYDEQNTEICVIYRQMDGYPEQHGTELEKFFKDKKMVNGISENDEDNFNGMNCLAARLISELKIGIGMFYLYPAGTRNMGEEYIYHIRYGKNNKPEIEIEIV